MALSGMWEAAQTSVAVSSFFRAAEWQLDQPAWSGRLRITAKGKIAFIKLEDKTSGKEEGRRRLRASSWGGRRRGGATPWR